MDQQQSTNSNDTLRGLLNYRNPINRQLTCKFQHNAGHIQMPITTGKPNRNRGRVCTHGSIHWPHYVHPHWLNRYATVALAQGKVLMSAPSEIAWYPWWLRRCQRLECASSKHVPTRRGPKRVSPFGDLSRMWKGQYHWCAQTITLSMTHPWRVINCCVRVQDPFTCRDPTKHVLECQLSAWSTHRQLRNSITEISAQTSLNGRHAQKKRRQLGKTATREVASATSSASSLTVGSLHVQTPTPYIHTHTYKVHSWT